MVTRAIGERGTTESKAIPFRVEVVSGPDTGLTVSLEGSVFVGTSELCGLRLRDSTVSRRHCRLEPRGKKVRVVDELSKNGTWLERVRVGDIDVGAGTDIRV